MRELSVHDAAFAVALDQFIENRAAHGEQVTRLAAENIAAMAAVIRIHPTRMAEDLGFAFDGDIVVGLSPELRTRARKHLEKTGHNNLVDRILLMLSELTVAQVEKYQEPQPIRPGYPVTDGVERVFHVAELLALPSHVKPGVLVLAETNSPALEETHEIWPTTIDLSLWAGVRPSPESPAQLDGLRTTPGILAIVVRPGVHMGRPVALAIAFAQHLLVLRAAGDEPAERAIVVSIDQEPLPWLGGLHRVLHFATRDAWSSRTTGLVDAAVWEWATQAEITAWYGGSAPDPRLLHEQASAVLAIRRAAREGRLGRSPEGQALMEALLDRIFDGRFVLKHLDLIERLLANASDGSPLV